MLCYRGIGDVERAGQSEALFRRFKADEASQTITARPRRQSPENNNERQMIHEHVSVPLSPGIRYDPSNTYPAADVFAKSRQTEGRVAAGGQR
jgi:hypothetical protein